jgi:hypothetical protein
MIRIAAALCVFLIFPSLAHATDPGILSPWPKAHFEDNGGLLCNGCKLFTYLAGTTTKQSTFTDSGMGTANTNPIILNVRGEANVWLDRTVSYKYVLSPATDSDPPTNAFWTIDNIAFSVSAASMTLGNNLANSGGTLQVNGNIIFGQPALHAYRSFGAGDQTLTSGVSATVIFDTADINTGTYYSTSTGKWTPLVAGTYTVSTCLTVGATWTAGDLVKLGVAKNGTNIFLGLQSEPTLTAGASSVCSGLVLVSMNGTTDYLNVGAFSEGTAPFVLGNTFASHLDGYRIGP